MLLFISSEFEIIKIRDQTMWKDENEAASKMILQLTTVSHQFMQI